MQQPRQPHTQARYEAFKQSVPEHEREIFDFADEEIVTEFTYWCIIKNRFPYDTMVRVNDLLVLKRPVTQRQEMNESEASEYKTIMENLANEDYYDAMIENFPRVQSVQKHVHIHLICWHQSN